MEDWPPLAGNEEGGRGRGGGGEGGRFLPVAEGSSDTEIVSQEQIYPDNFTCSHTALG